MRAAEQTQLDQMLLHREFSVVAKSAGTADVYAAVARSTGDADNGNQYWVQIKDGQTRYEACIVGDWEFDSLIGALERIYRETGGLLKGVGDSGFALNPQTADGLWLAPNEELVTLMKVTLSFATGDSFTGTGEEAERGTLFNFGLHTTSQQLLVQVERPNEIGMITRERFDVRGAGATPTVVISRDALSCLMEAALGDGAEFGLLRHPRRDWIVGYTDLAGRPTADEIDFAVRSIEERLDRRLAEESTSNGMLMLLKSILRFRTVEILHRIDKEHLVAHLFSGHVGQTIREHIVRGHSMEFVFDNLRVMHKGDRLHDFPGALALLLMPGAVLEKPDPNTHVDPI